MGEPNTAASPPRDPQDPLIGRVLAGKFEIESLIGRGGMGAVYRARQKTLKRPVAIKVLRQELMDDPSYALRFQREASAASRIDHPNLIRVHDFGQDDGLLYIAMELVEGQGLQTVLREHGALPTEQIVDLMSQLLAALGAMHEQGIVHRDLKPENIMLVEIKDDDGHHVDMLKVCDFGIAKQLRAQNEPGMTGVTNTATLTATGALVGTPEYMSPEQAKGEDVDAGTDIYAAGIILFQMLTGRLPFKSSNSMKVLLAHLSEMPTMPSDLVPTVDRALEEVCLKALAKERDERFATARDMRAHLRQGTGLRDSALTARRPSLLTKSSGASVAKPPTTAKDVATLVASPTPPEAGSSDAGSSDRPAALTSSSSGVQARGAASGTLVSGARSSGAPPQLDTPSPTALDRAPSIRPPASLPPPPAPAPEPTAAAPANQMVPVLLGLIVVLLAVIAVLVMKK